MRPLLRYAGLDFVWLPDCDVPALAVALDDEVNRRWMTRHGKSVVGTLQAAAQGCLEGRFLYLGVYRPDGEVVGRCGINSYRGLPGTVQTSTHLAIGQRGRGVNRLVKSVQWELVLAHGHRQLVMSANVDNAPSRAAMRSVARDDRDGYLTDYSAMTAVVEEDWYPRTGERLVLRRPPYGHLPFSDEDRAQLEDRLRALPSWPALAARR